MSGKGFQNNVTQGSGNNSNYVINVAKTGKYGIPKTINMFETQQTAHQFDDRLSEKPRRLSIQ